MRSLNTSCKQPGTWDPAPSPTTCCFHPNPTSQHGNPQTQPFLGCLPHPGPLPTLAEGELLMMAVSTPIAWTAMASELPSKTYRDMGVVGLLSHGVGGDTTHHAWWFGYRVAPHDTCWSPASGGRAGTSSWASPASRELLR